MLELHASNSGPEVTYVRACISSLELVPRDRRCGHPVVLPVTNLTVQTMPNDTPPVLSNDELRVLSYGPRFIPIRPIALEHGEWQQAISQFEHRLAVFELLQGESLPTRTVEHTLVALPYQRVGAGWLKLAAGPLRNAVHALRSTVEREIQRTSVMGSDGDGTFTNLSVGEIRAMRTLMSRKDLVVRECDKGLGPCVMSKEWYNTAVATILGDTTSYEKLPASFTKQQAVDTVHAELDALVADFDFGHRGGRKLTAESVFGLKSSVGIARFYVLPKLHKYHPIHAPYAARPIVADVNSVTAIASSMVNDTLTQVISHTSPHPWVIKDTLEFLNEIATIPIEKGDIIFSWDVVALYPSIPHDVALEAVRKEVEDWESKVYHDRMTEYNTAFAKWCSLPPSKRNVSPPSPPNPPRRTAELVTRLLHVVLTNAYFASCDGDEEELYRQRKGIAMGTAAAPPVANITMYHHMKALVCRWVKSGKLRYLKSFLDDGFGVFRGTMDEYRQLYAEANSLSPHIQFTESHSNQEVQFLDVTVYVGANTDGSLALLTRPYTKVWNKFLYIPPFSGHAPHTLASFIASETQRLVRNSSREEDAVLAALAFANHLLERGYDKHTVISQMCKVSFAKRPQYLVRKAANSNKRQRSRGINTIALTLPYRPLVSKLRIPTRLKKVQQQLGPATRVVVGWSTERRLQCYLHVQWPQGDAVTNTDGHHDEGRQEEGPLLETAH